MMSATPDRADENIDLELVGLQKIFDDKAVIQNVDLQVRKGEFLAILGPSGSGKSTLIKIVAGFERQSAGVVILQGKDVSDLPPYRRNVNTVFQSYALFPHLSVFENVAYGLRRKGMKGEALRSRVSEALELVDLARFAGRAPNTLSGGEQQRIAIARALVNRPAVLLLDEPLSALDLKIRHRMQREIKRIHQDVGTTFLYVTHDQEEALVLADRIMVLRSGHCEQIGTGVELYHHPATHFVADFIGETNWYAGVLTHGADGPVIILEDGTRVRVQAGREPAPDTKVVFGVRPERIYLVSDGEPCRPAENRITVMLTNQIFQGSNLRIEGRTSWGAFIGLTRQIDGVFASLQSARTGQTATLAWDVSATLLFPAPGDGSGPRIGA